HRRLLGRPQFGPLGRRQPDSDLLRHGGVSCRPRSYETLSWICLVGATENRRRAWTFGEDPREQTLGRQPRDGARDYDSHPRGRRKACAQRLSADRRRGRCGDRLTGGGDDNSTAFSPTDALPLSGRIELPMMTQALASIVTVAVFVARAINNLQ